MNYKLIFPTFRRRYRFVKEQLEALSLKPEKVLNLGSGEGDYDYMIAQHCRFLHSCDIHPGDVNFALWMNGDVENVAYQVQDAMDLTYPSGSFDLLLCMEVIEHVSDSECLMRESARVLRPGGTAIMTFPSDRFPFAYDPINRILHMFGTHIPIGAYGYGHSKLIDPVEFEGWAKVWGFEIVEKVPLTGHLTGIFELYYPSIIQKFLKPNSGNSMDGKDANRPGIRPSRKDPWLGRITDILIDLDILLFGRSRSSVNMGYVLRKKS